ncbi:SET domain protein [Cristinia sonorae]|uniref:SET domain protein n=1 Tax=Cristinia sonorae TaxID=1940300 RepID=A0A8K0UPB1_9AGAR|nr:SET domain protein [Cristinia sonorae]
MSTHASKPHRWPSQLQYLDALCYHSSVPAVVRVKINPRYGRGGRSEGISPRPPVAIRPIVDSSHPACGQFGLYATKKIPSRTLILDYLGEVHCDERPESDYDLSLYRTQDGLSVGVDASRMGNEARFINDFRGVKSKPNAVFEERRTVAGDLYMSVWSSSEVIKKGEEILVSYGKGFWKARDTQSSS